MTALLPRLLRTLPGLLALLLLLAAAGPARASHLLGGEMTYKYLDATGPSTAPLRYEITLSVYVTCVGGFSSSTTIALYNQSTGALISGNSYSRTSVTACITATLPPGCTNTGASQQPYQIHTFVATVNLPRSSVGYYAYFTEFARNATISNLVNGGNEYLTLYTAIAPSSYANKSPVFVNPAIGLLCLNDTTVLLNNATDADGDRLVYSYGNAYSVATYPAFLNPPLASVAYRTAPAPGPYTGATPLGISPNSAKIDPATGISKFYATVNGAQYVVAIDVKEYRMVGGTEVLIGTTRRDIQLVVGICPPSTSPTLTAGGGSTSTSNYTVEAGGTLTIPISASQSATPPNPLEMKVSSGLLDGAGPINATFVGDAGTPVGSVTTTGTGTVGGNFIYTPACSEARPNPYDVLVQVQDKGCSGKLAATALHITVTKPSGPTAIAGPAQVCGLGTPQSYSSSGGTAPGVSWRIYPKTGGTFASASTASPVQITWTAAGTYTLRARGVSQYGCLTDSVSQTVVVAPAPTLTVTGSQAICQGASTSLTPAGGTAPYTLTDGTTSQTGAGPFTVSPTQTTTYTLTSTATGGACPGTAAVVVTVNPLPAANVGATPRSTCSGQPLTLGATAVAGSTYSWSPTTGLSSATVANPTLTLPNTTSAATTTTYTLTETITATGCQATNSVAVTVNPAVIVLVGVNQTTCSGVPTSLGGNPVAGYTYNWSPTTGLSSATVANPTVTLTNTTGAATTTTYTLTTTDAASGCTGTGTVTVTVNPAVTAQPGAAVTICSGTSATLGAAPVTGLTYQWSPATGLSSATVANPTVTLTNTTGAAATTTYTLTTTNTATGCFGTGTVTVTTTPLPVAQPGAAITVCSGVAGQLGAAPVTGQTYSWSPATGLSSATVANPTVTLTNTTGAATTQAYTLTTTAGSCTSTGTVTVTVNAAVTAQPGAAVAICSGGTGQLGAAPVAGNTYSWSPATGLSSPTVANPTVTLTNTTGAATTQTYTLTTTNTATGCLGTATVLVTVNPLPAANVGTTPRNTCSGVPITLGAAAVAGNTYLWSPATGLSSATAANPTLTLTNTTGAATTQTYTLTQTTTATGCTATNSVTVTVNPAVVVLTGVPQTTCSGVPASLGGNPVAGYTYSWSPATGLSSATVANPTVTLTNTTGAATTTTYTLTITSAAGCVGTGSVTVTVNPAVTAQPGAAAAICSGGTGQLGAAPVAGQTYSWSPATGLSSATVANPTVTLTNTTGAATTTTYTLTTTNPATGCVGTGTVAVTVNPAVAVAAGSAVTFCSGNSAQLGAAPVAGYTYQWSPATGLSSATVANPTVTLTNTTSAATTITYTLTATGAGSCQSTGTVAVTVNPAVMAQPGAATTTCSGIAVQLGAAPVAGYIYQWSPATGLSSATVANPTVTLTNTTGTATTTTYTLTTTNTATTCVGTGTVAITVTPNPTAAPGAATTVCSGVAGQLGAAPVAGQTYSWSPATGLSSATAANPTVTLTNTSGAATTQTYTLTTTSAAGCIGTGTVVVTVNPAVTALPGAAVAICSGLTGQLGDVPVAGQTYSWSPATGLSSATAANPTVTLTNTSGAATTQTYTLTTTSAAGCVGTGTVAVTVNPAVTAQPGAAIAICSGLTGQLGDAAVAGYTYQWSPATGLSSATAANPTVTLTNTSGTATTQTYTLTTTSAAGCIGTGTVVVTVNPAVTAQPGAAVTICSGLTGQLGDAPVVGFTYQWSPATGLSSATVANPTVTLTNTSGAATTQTYTLTTTSAAGCVGTGTVAVTVNPAVTAMPGAAIAICSGLTGQLGAAPVAGFTYQWSPATGLSSATVANPTVTLTNTTGTATTQTYTLTTTSAAGCVGTGTVVVTVNPAVTAQPGAAVTICSGLTGQLGAAGIAGYTYSWSPATGLSSPTVANPTVTLTNTTGAATTTTYTLTATSAVGCVGTGTVVVTVNPAITALPGAAITTCSGVAAQLGSAPVAGLTYSWSPATGLSSATVANPTVTLTNTTGAATTTTYTLTTTDATTGCLGTGTVAVTIEPAVTAQPGTAIAICSGLTGQLGDAPVTGYTYQWSPATGLSSATAANPTVTLTNTSGAATTQMYTLTTTSAAGCIGTGTVVVTVNPAVTAQPGTAIAICSGLTGQLGDAPVAGYSYQWSPATGLSSATAANPTVTLTNTSGAATTQTYTLTTTSAAGCVGTGTVVVTVNPAVTALPGVDIAICSGLTGQLGDAPVAGYAYSWTPTTGLSSATAANPTVTLTNTTGAATTTTYTLTTTSAAGCIGTGTVTVTVNPAVTAQPGAAVTICSGSSAQLGAISVAGYTYQWSPATGLSSATAANPTVTLTNTTGANTTRTYTLTATSAAGCVGTGTVAVTVYPAVLAGIVGTDQTVCSGNTPTPLTSTSSASGGDGTFAYQWESSPDNLTWTAVPGATSLTYAPGPVTATVYYRRRVTAGPCGAFYSNTVTLLLQVRPTTTVTLATPVPQCPSVAYTFTAVVANAGPTPTYQWFVNNVPVATTPTLTSVSLATGDQIRVEVTATPGFCASGSAQATVTYQLVAPATPPTVVIATTTPLPACAGAPVRFSITSAAPLGASTQYQWQVDGVDVTGATAATFSPTTLRDGQTVRLVLTTSTACAPILGTSNAVAVSIIPAVDVEAGPDKTITEGDEVVLQGSANGPYPVTWTPAAGLTFSGPGQQAQLHPRAAPLTTTTYTLSAGSGSCTDASSVTVTVLPRIGIPSAFSPNGDGRDDTWEIDQIGAYTVNKVVVFNRWGAKVFERAGYDRSSEWNGTANGQPVPVGTYYFVITLSSGKSYTGPLTVIY